LYRPILILMIALTLLPAFSGSAEDAREIIRKVLDRDDGTTQITRMKLSSFRYKKQGNTIARAENPRVKEMETVRKGYGPREEDTKTVTIIIEPIKERGIGFLQYDYDVQGKESDQWIYLSALGKVKRIVSGSENEPKTGSFFGTEISYEDMESRHLDDYEYKVLAEETYQERSCWVIESIPTPERARKSTYSKVWQWVDKERNLSLKMILHNRQGQKVKRITFSDIEQIDGIWVPRQMTVNSLKTRRMTILTLEATALNIPVQDDFLTQRTLTDRVFREQSLKKYRETLK